MFIQKCHFVREQRKPWFRLAEGGWLDAGGVEPAALPKAGTKELEDKPSSESDCRKQQHLEGKHTSGKPQKLSFLTHNLLVCGPQPMEACAKMTPGPL